MSVTEALMKPGQWDVTLRPDTPLSVRNSIQWLGTFVVTATHVADSAISLSNLYGQAIYSGIIRRRKDAMHTFGGPSILAWLGDEQGKGVPCAPPSAAGTWQSSLHYNFATAVPTRMAGAIEGSYFSTNGTPIGSTIVNAQNTPWRQTYDPVAEQVGVEYRLKPNRVLDSSGVGVAGVFAQTPTVVIQPGNSGRDRTYVGLKVVTLNNDEDMDSYASTVDGYGTSPVGGVGTVATSFYDPSGVAENIHRSTSVTATSNADAALQATAEVAKFANVQQSISCSVDEYAIPRLCIPGDYVYVYDVENDLIDTANQVVFRGQTIFPVKVRLMGYTWPLQQGMGCYAVNSDSATPTYTDITEWIVWDTGAETRLDIAALPRPLGSSVGHYQFA